MKTEKEKFSLSMTLNGLEFPTRGVSLYLFKSFLERRIALKANSEKVDKAKWIFNEAANWLLPMRIQHSKANDFFTVSLRDVKTQECMQVFFWSFFILRVSCGKTKLSAAVETCVSAALYFRGLIYVSL